jgi:hypothetical protein
MHSTDNLDDGYVGSGQRLWKSINKHGRENHVCEILEFLPDRESLKAREAELVNEETIHDEMCMNLALGGGYQWPLSQTPEAKTARINGVREFWKSDAGEAAKISIAEKISNRVVSKETRDLQSIVAKERMKNLKDSGKWEDAKKKNSLAHTGKIQSAEAIEKRAASIKRTREENGPHKFSDQARENISKSLLGSSRNKKTWILVNEMTGEESSIENLQKWLRDNQFTAPTSTVVRDSSNKIIFRLRKAENK